MRENHAAFFLVSDRSKTQELCINAVEADPCQLYDISDYLKTHKMCDNMVRRDSCSFQLSLIGFLLRNTKNVA